MPAFEFEEALWPLDLDREPALSECILTRDTSVAVEQVALVDVSQGDGKLREMVNLCKASWLSVASGKVRRGLKLLTQYKAAQNLATEVVYTGHTYENNRVPLSASVRRTLEIGALILAPNFGAPHAERQVDVDVLYLDGALPPPLGLIPTVVIASKNQADILSTSALLFVGLVAVGLVFAQSEVAGLSVASLTALTIYSHSLRSITTTTRSTALQLPDSAFAPLTVRALVNFSAAILGERGRASLYAAAEAASAQRLVSSQGAKSTAKLPSVEDQPPLAPLQHSRLNGPSAVAAHQDGRAFASAQAAFAKHWPALVLGVALRQTKADTHIDAEAALAELLERVEKVEPENLVYFN